MSHYVCTGECNGVSEKFGVCGDPTCSRHGRPLRECGCVDGNHEHEKEESSVKNNPRSRDNT